MTLEEKVIRTLAELGASDAEGSRLLFAEVRAAMEEERRALIDRGAKSERERDLLAKAFRDRWLARKNGLLAKADENWLKQAPRDFKPAVGKDFNELRKLAAGCEYSEIVRAIPLHFAAEVTDTNSHSEEFTASLQPPIATPTDLTLPGHHRVLGSLHPITQVTREIEDIFLHLGFGIETGPEIEKVYYNFDALNIPESHPSRDDWDTLYIDSQTVLRTHTSPVQIRAMQKYGAPLYIVIPGKCYRRDNPDSTHSPMFHQIEGLAVAENITFADLKGTLDYFARRFFGGKTRTSFHPSFFPFTEPSGEVAISCPFCDGDGCRVCKQSGWIEVMGCGMVHPEVLRHGGIDPERYSGWAFGLGVERYAMMKYGISDIQLFYRGDMRFLEQF
ncbi:MAG: phenylalanine--tRNA ligase subunit alpha [Acidobacteriota bacterium]|nr:phenylalanine--tRNA ligase subunit alpha [Acidobacteriota bacterium]